jgi:hypothetical protein
MRAVIEAGASLEFATPSEVREAVDGALSAAQPSFRRRKATGLFPAAGRLLLNLGTPGTGQLWEVRHLSISGADPTTTITGTALIGTGGHPSQAVLSGADPVDPFGIVSSTNNLPADAGFSDLEVVVGYREVLYVIVVGATVGAQFAANALVVERRMKDIDPDAILLDLQRRRRP